MSAGKFLISLALAISVGIIAVISATLYLGQRAAVPGNSGTAASLPASIPTRNVVVVSKAVPVGTVLDESHLKVAAVPLYDLAPGHFLNVSEVLGRKVASDLTPEQTVVSDLLLAKEPEVLSRELAASLSDGFRAVSLSMSEVGGVSGFVLPGNRVDVLLSASSAAGGQFSRVVLQDIKILAVAQDRWVQDRSVPRPAGLVTLEVTPSQAEMLDMARSVGTVSFALRAQDDKSVVTTLGVRQEELNGSKSVVEIIRGTVRSFQ